MAYVAVNRSDPTGGVCYYIHHAVGSGAANHRDDVLLVQWLLRRIHRDNTTRPWTPPTPDLPMDGWVGPDTVGWIKSYQAALKARGLGCVVDGRVDPCPEDRPPAVAGLHPTLVWMNTWLRLDNPTAYLSPTNDPDCPEALTAALAAGRPAPRSGPLVRPSGPLVRPSGPLG